MATLENAIALAVSAHQGQTDKAGRPYILHPLRLMLQMRHEWEMMAAVLHDVVEDSDCTLAQLREAGYPEEVVTAVDCLTKREGETYEDFVERARQNPIARKVKLADLEDNMDVKRLPILTDKDVARLQKYRRIWGQLQSP